MPCAMDSVSRLRADHRDVDPLATAKRFLVSVLSLTSLIVGGVAYVAWRPHSLYLFTWLEILGLENLVILVRHYLGDADITRWLLWSAPSGLWAFSGALAMRVLWWKTWSLQAWCWSVVIPLSGIASELGQLAGIPGTFDPVDLGAYVVGCLLAALVVFVLETK